MMALTPLRVVILGAVVAPTLGMPSGATPPTTQWSVSTAWVRCNGQLLPTGDVGGAFSGKATPPYVNQATRVHRTSGPIDPRHRNSLIGFALYRTWAAPHWLLVESYAAATLCAGPWVGSVDGRGSNYTATALGPRLPAGTYSLALLWTRRLGDRPPFTFLYAELSNRAFRLPGPSGKPIRLWGCNLSPGNATCYHPLFRTV